MLLKVNKIFDTLPESQALPSAKNFAEYFISGTRQRMSLPSAQTRTLDNDTTLGKAGLYVLFVECLDMSLGKDFLCRVSTSHTRQILARR